MIHDAEALSRSDAVRRWRPRARRTALSWGERRRPLDPSGAVAEREQAAWAAVAEEPTSGRDGAAERRCFCRRPSASGTSMARWGSRSAFAPGEGGERGRGVQEMRSPCRLRDKFPDRYVMQ